MYLNVSASTRGAGSMCALYFKAKLVKVYVGGGECYGQCGGRRVLWSMWGEESAMINAINSKFVLIVLTHTQMCSHTHTPFPCFDALLED